MEKELKIGLMAIDIKVLGLMEKKKAMELFIGLMAVDIQVIGKMTQ